MNYALSMNLILVVAILICLFVTGNPLCMLGFMFIQNLPYNIHPSVLDHQREQMIIDTEREEPKPIGFTADI
jgi:hypothetical protein